ncbi:hypothetical protein HDU76_006899 [Blyttiomyces sp. JEL0837]|nr:hypothetical protein HDU76_006899 [Blyttiomyces sp. JEL0837]
MKETVINFAGVDRWCQRLLSSGVNPFFFTISIKTTQATLTRPSSSSSTSATASTFTVSTISKFITKHHVNLFPFHSRSVTTTSSSSSQSQSPIKGHATIEGTTRLRNKKPDSSLLLNDTFNLRPNANPQLASASDSTVDESKLQQIQQQQGLPRPKYHQIKTNKLWISGVGFGGFRIGNKVDVSDNIGEDVSPLMRSASLNFLVGGDGGQDGGKGFEAVRGGVDVVKRALRVGVNVFDTSSHFGNGNSEVTIGQGIREAIEEGVVERDEIIVISKCGHILTEPHLTTWKSHASKSPPQKFHLTNLSQKASHSIHPTFIKSEISSSLSRMGLSTIDIYMINNPERLIHGGSMTMNELLHKHIYEAFVCLEREVQDGRIKGYGVSCNTMHIKGVDGYIDLKEVSEVARKAYAEVFGNKGVEGDGLEKEGGSSPNFVAVEYPLNLFEKDAVDLVDGGEGEKTLAEVAEDLGLYQLTQRPLFAIANGTVRCLGDKIPETTEYSSYQDHQLTNKLTNLFTKATETESEIMELISLDTDVSVESVSNHNSGNGAHVHLSKMIWAQVLSENLERLVTSTFAGSHYFKSNVVNVLKRDLEDLYQFVESNSGGGEELIRIREWGTRYLSQIESLCWCILEISSVYERSGNREIAIVLSALATGLKQRYVGLDGDEYIQEPSLSQFGLRVVESALVERTRGWGGTVLVGMNRGEWVDYGVLACGDGVEVLPWEQVTAVLWCSLLE